MSAHRCGTHRPCRPPEYRQVQPAQPPGRREGVDRLGQAADHAPPDHRDPHHAGVPVRVRRRARPAGAGAQHAQSPPEPPRHRGGAGRRCRAVRGGGNAFRAGRSCRAGEDPAEPAHRGGGQQDRYREAQRAAIAVPRPPGENPGIRRHRADQRQDREKHPAAAEGPARGAARGAGGSIRRTSSPTATSASSPPSCCARSCSSRWAPSCRTAATW